MHVLRSKIINTYKVYTNVVNTNYKKFIDKVMNYFMCYFAV